MEEFPEFLEEENFLEFLKSEAFEEILLSTMPDRAVGFRGCKWLHCFRAPGKLNVFFMIGEEMLSNNLVLRKLEFDVCLGNSGITNSEMLFRPTEVELLVEEFKKFVA